MTWVCAWCGQSERMVRKGQCGALFTKCDTTKPKKKPKKKVA